MKLSTKIVPVVLLLAVETLGTGAATRTGPFRAEALTPGVHLFSPSDPADRDRTNSLVVERADGLLVVNAQPTPAAARELLAEIGERFPKRKVRTLVLSHPHADSAGGASAFPADVLVVGSEGAAVALADPAFDFGAEAKARGGERWTEPPRPQIGLRLAGNAVLWDAERPVSLLPVARAHTTGDLLVDLPTADVAVVGSILSFDRNPWTGHGYLAGWIAMLNDLATQGRARIVPLQGPVADAGEVRRQRELFAWVRSEVESAYVDRTPTPEVAARVLASPRLGTFFDLSAQPSFARQVVDTAVQEAVAYRRKYGLDK